MYGQARPDVGAVRRRTTTLALAGAALNIALAVGLGLIRAAGSTTGQRHVEGTLPNIALVIALCAPGVVALIGVALARPVLFGAAGFACGPLVIVSIVAFPMLLPCGLLIAAFVVAQTGSGAESLRARDVIIVGGFALPIVAGLWLLITRTAEFTYTFASGGSEGGDYFTPAHAKLCIVLVVVDVVLACVVAGLSSAQRTTRNA